MIPIIIYFYNITIGNFLSTIQTQWNYLDYKELLWLLDYEQVILLLLDYKELLLLWNYKNNQHWFIVKSYFKHQDCTQGITVIVEKGLDNPSSNPGCGSLIFTPC